MGSIAVSNGWISAGARRETMEEGETRAIGIKPEDGSVPRAAVARRPVQGGARQQQWTHQTLSVNAHEAVEVCETGAVRIELENAARARATASPRSAIEGVIR